VGSAVLGALIGAGAGGWLLSAAGAGFCGPLTTFSTFGYETVRLLADGAYGIAAGYVAISVAAGLGVASAAASGIGRLAAWTPCTAGHSRRGSATRAWPPPRT